jgi:putative nucleotidyltransferase with HDIG domain
MGTLSAETNGFVTAGVSIAAAVLLVIIIVFKRFYVKAISSIAEHADRYNTLLQVTKEIRQENNSAVLCEKILDYAIAITGAKAGIIMLRDDNELTFQVSRGPNEILDVLANVPSCEYCLISSTCGKNGPADNTPPPTFTDQMKKPGISSLICLPLQRFSLSGVIRLAHSSPGEFSNDDYKAAEYFSFQAALSLENAMFIEGHVNFEQHMTELLIQAMDNHLPVKVEHAKRVAHYSKIIAKNIDLNDKRIKVLHSACLLHDIGFVKFLPCDEMNSDTYLKHTTVGHSLLSEIIFFKQIANIVLHHHERYDGTGYPSMLKGENIPLESRIIAIAESFDTITSKESYRTPKSFNDAMAEMQKNSGTQFDPLLLDTFVKNVRDIL